jgi:hypothetical protein
MEVAAAMTLQSLCRGHLVLQIARHLLEQVRAARAELAAAEEAAVAAEQELDFFVREERED